MEGFLEYNATVTAMASKVNIEVGGHLFKIPRDLLENGPPSRLQEMYRAASASNKTCVITVERPHEMFSAILTMYQTGELHIPMTSCPGAFMNELEFWEIPVESLASCCYNRMQCFHDEQETLRQFRESLKEETYPKAPNTSHNSIQSLRYKLWNLVEYRNRSVLARIYFILTLLMVLLSIFILAVKTDSNFQREMTNCERLGYMKSAGMEDFDLVRETLEQNCDDEKLPGRNDHFVVRGGMDRSNSEDYTFLYVEVVDNGRGSSGSNNDNSTSDRTDNNSTKPLLKNIFGKFVKVPNMKVTIYTLSVLEIVTLAFFTVDLVLRLVSCPSLKNYFFCIINITDALALVCTYIHLLVMYMHEHKRYTDGWVDLLEYSQMLRALRLFRIVSSIRAGKVLAYSIRANLKDLSILFLFLIAGMCSFASCFYIAEDKKNVSSILIGWYWAVVTMTTVGYGDISPESEIGRFIACLCAMSGVLLFALTLPIFANHFLTLYQHADSRQAFKKYHGGDSTPATTFSVTNGKEKKKLPVDKDNTV